MGPVYEYGPETMFKTPVTISLPYDSYDSEKQNLSIAYRNPAGKWQLLESSVDNAEKLAKTKTTRLSAYRIAVTTTTGGRYATAGLRQEYATLAGPDPAFRLGEVYVFPNPA